VSQRGRCRVAITHIMALRCDTEAPLDRAEPVHLALAPLVFHARFPRWGTTLLVGQQSQLFDLPHPASDTRSLTYTGCDCRADRTAATTGRSSIQASESLPPSLPALHRMLSILEGTNLGRCEVD
jgi:hypothetical protein